jgi:hypothetical protein
MCLSLKSVGVEMGLLVYAVRQLTSYMWWIDMLLDLRHDFFARNERPAMVLVWWQSVAVLCVLWLGGERRRETIE